MRISDWSSDVCSSDLADVKTVAPAIFAFAFFNSGQVCAIIKRLYIHDSLYDAMCEEIVTYARGAKVAGGRDPEAQFVPVQNQAQYDKVLSYLEGARARGQNNPGGDVTKDTGYVDPLKVG